MRAMLNRWLASNRFALGSIIFIWILVRIYPAFHTSPILCTEVWEAHKLLDYGFLQRHGAVLSPGHETGILSNPAEFNYTHHPYPIYWFYTLIYSLGGAYGDLAFVLVAKLAGCILVFKLLDRQFERFAAWLATVLFAIAPCGILQDCDTDLVATSALLWPVGAAYLLAKHRAADSATNPSFWQGGLLAFIAGQVSWFTLVMIPALMVLAGKQASTLREMLTGLRKNRLAIGLLAGGVFSFLLFLLQVAIYEPNFSGLLGHLRLKMGDAPDAIPKAQLFKLIPVRTVLFAGVPLLIGAVAGFAALSRNRSPLTLAAAVYFPCFALAIVAIPNFFYTDNHVYGSLLFPAAVLTAVTIQSGRQILPWVLCTLALPGIAYMQLSFAASQISGSARIMAALMQSHTAKTDFVFTNLEPMKPPYKPSDVNGGRATRFLSDRIIYFGFSHSVQFDDLPKLLKHSEPSLLYLLDRSRPIEADLLTRITRTGKLETTATVAFPPVDLNLADRLRAFVWYKLMRKGKADTDTAESLSGQRTFEIYRLDPHAFLPGDQAEKTKAR